MNEASNPYTTIQEELRKEAQDKLPERCRGCGHIAVGLARVAQDFETGLITRQDASYEIEVAADEIAIKCILGRVESTNIPGKYMCSYEILNR